MAKKTAKRPSVMGRDKWKRKQEEAESKRRGSNPIKLPEGIEWLKVTKKGVRRLHLVPYEVTDPKHPEADVGDLYYYRPFSQHRNVGPDNARIICPRTWGAHCPICVERARLKDDGSDEDTLRALNASDRGLYLFQDADADDPEKLYAYESGMFAKGGAPGFGMMLKNEIQYQDDDEKLPWDWDGPGLKIRFAEEKFKGSPYYPAEKIDLEEMGKNMDPALLDTFPSLDEWLIRLSTQAVEALFLGISGEEGQEPGEEPEPRKKKERAAPTRPAAKEPEPDPEEDPEEPEPDPEEDPEEPEPKDAMSVTEARKYITKWDPDDVDFDDDDEAEEARTSLLAAAAAAGVRYSSLPQALIGSTNNTEKGICKLRLRLVELLPPEPPPEEPAKKKKPEKEKKKPAKDECPHGHEFGTDWLNFPECQDCAVEDSCMDAST